jgi:hypothetical protein
LIDLYSPTLAEVSWRHVIVAEKTAQAEMKAAGKSPNPEKKLNLR